MLFFYFSFFQSSVKVKVLKYECTYFAYILLTTVKRIKTIYLKGYANEGLKDTH